jgi:hypothetical protein
MGKSYGTDRVQLKPAKLTHSLHAAIGKLVRAMAEIEDMVDLHIGNLAGTSEAGTTILLGRTAIVRRIEIAEALAATRDDETLEIHKKVFSDTYSTLVDCRNAVAHGTLLGQDENGRLFFQSSISRPLGQDRYREVLSYLPHHIISNAAAAQRLVPLYETLLNVRDKRAIRLQRPLDPHPKILRQRSAKPQRPPQSS